MEVKSTVNEVIGIAKEIGGFWSKLAKMFGAGAAPVPQGKSPQPVAKKAYVAVDETQVMADIVTQLSQFFKLQEQLADHIREEEEKSRSVYDPDANLMEAALKRVMALDQMALLETEIREAMVYQAPPEMGALYSKVFEMRDTIKIEQDKARKKRDDESWQRKEEERLLRERQAYLLATFLFLLYMWLLLGFLPKIGR
tara:strand:- start:610 stop:1203 length:594 start_codon:yes stop_codon:yes gene_type:complete